MRLIKRVSGLISHQIGEEFIVINPEKGEFYSLNPVGALIWKFMSRQRSIREISAKIVAEYKVDKRLAAQDATRFIKKYTGSLFKLNSPPKSR